MRTLTVGLALVVLGIMMVLSPGFETAFGPWLAFFGSLLVVIGLVLAFVYWIGRADAHSRTS